MRVATFWCHFLTIVVTSGSWVVLAPKAIANPGAQQPPSLTPSQIPSGFTAEWGNYFVSGSVYGYERYQSRQWTTDGCLNAGVGFGNPRQAVSLELDYNQESLAGDPAGGSVDIRLGRTLVNNRHLQMGLSAGWLAAASYGDVSMKGNSPYGAITAAWPLQPQNPEFRQTMQVTLGGGAGRFQRIDGPSQVGNGVFASVGVEVSPILGLSVGWAGRGINAGISLVPSRQTPITITLSGINLANTDNGGRAAALTMTWGGNFRTARF